MSNAELHKGALLKRGEYRIERTLGQGGFGITYEAEQVSLGRKVAVKEFYMKDYCYRNEATRFVSTASSGSRDMVDSFRRKFVKEARMLAEFKHRSIVRVLDVFEENDTAYYVMEYLEGGSLQSMVRRKGRLEEEEAVKYISEICDALSYIHSRHTLHLDVKPGNIMLDSEGRAVLIDFGISKRIDSDGNLTTTTPLCLSKGFAPFEQIAQEPGSSYTASTDIYSLGATLYCLLTGKTPYDASTLIDGLPTSELKSAGVSVRTIKAISAAMQFRREKRPQSASEFKKLLCCTTSGKGFPKWLIGVLAGLVAVVAIVLFARRNRSDGGMDPANPTVNDNVQTTAVATQPESAVQPAAEKPSQPEKPAVIALESIALSKTSLTLEEGVTSTLTVKYSPSNVTDKSTTWKSTDASVAKVSSTGKVTAVTSGSAAIIASCGGKDAFCNITVKEKTNPIQQQQENSSSNGNIHNGHEWVDLGLSVLWATCNVGASKPEGFGDLYAWGETSTKTENQWSTYIYSNDDYGKLTKYCSDRSKGYNGYTDRKTMLELSDDVASKKWGGSWRMPTITEINELLNNCIWTYTTINGINGCKIISKKPGYTDNFIFLPAAGFRNGTSATYIGTYGEYWSSSLSADFSDYACGIHFIYNQIIEKGNNGIDLRLIGRSVRPVLNKESAKDSGSALNGSVVSAKQKPLVESNTTNKVNNQRL